MQSTSKDVSRIRWCLHWLSSSICLGVMAHHNMTGRSCLADHKVVFIPVIQWFPNFFERDSNLSLVNTSCPKPEKRWMIFGRKLLRSFSRSAIFSFLKYLRHKQTHTSSGNVATIQLRFGSSWRDPFSYPSRSLFGSRPILWESLLCTNPTLRWVNITLR